MCQHVRHHVDTWRDHRKRRASADDVHDRAASALPSHASRGLASQEQLLATLLPTPSPTVSRSCDVSSYAGQRRVLLEARAPAPSTSSRARGSRYAISLELAA